MCHSPTADAVRVYEASEKSCILYEEEFSEVEIKDFAKSC